MNSRARSGFTLIEVLIAMVVLSIGLAGMIPVLIQATRGNSFGKATTQAVTFSQDKLEELRREPFFVVSGGSSVANPLLAAGGPTTTGYFDTPATGFSRSWVIQNSGGLYSANVLGIEVTTVWTDAQGVDHPGRAFTVKSNLNL